MNQALTQSIQNCREHIDHYLLQKLQQLPMSDARLLDAMRHSLLLGGKRIRPLLVYLTGELKAVSADQMAPVAAAIESIHAYSLVHDDLPAMDDDQLRRGQPTCHIAFDEATAILAGDALQTLAFELLSQAHAFSAEKRLAMIQELSQAAGFQGMCGGQAVDIAATGKQQSLDELERMHQLKTGALIRAAVRLGAIASGIEIPEHRRYLDQYAQAIGLAFQVRDDILDVTSDTQTLGKPQGSDISHHKSTYPSLLGLAKAQQKCELLRHEALQALEGLPYNTDKLALLADYIVQRDK
ncbi:(2E,6E)-farnesyl diphosphate synthase [Celerinatantimonas sp. YJH-8]|uniref:(2E,6E)-farnesyl diphosphate synthase n=1 Tax=Celerinatantimonas sp. YJH-8 TaxID=3228714 RepID=UPI0038C52349